MGSKKKAPKAAKAPKAPTPTPPVSIQGPMGSALYSGGKYTFDNPNEAANSANLQTAQQGFAGALSQVQNPTEAMNNQMSVYRNSMQPAYEHTMNQQMGKATAGLGKKYASTFGQLSLADLARNQAQGSANLERDIYDSGQSAYDRLISRAGQQGNLAGAAQNMQLKPYQVMGEMLNPTGSNVTGFNTSQNQIYDAQMTNYTAMSVAAQQAKAAQQGQFIQALGAMTPDTVSIGGK